MKRLLLLVFLFCPSLFAGVLGDTVSQMQPGVWAVITPANKSVISGTNVTNLADSGCWDPASDKFMMIGSDHASAYMFPQWSDSTNAWAAGPPLIGVQFSTSYVGHAFDGNTSDGQGNCYYRVRRSSVNGASDIYRYNVASGVWSTLPLAPTSYSGYCCQGIAYFPEINSIIWPEAAGKIMALNLTTNTWSVLATISIGSGSWKFTEYNPVQKIVLIGNGSTGQLWRLNAAGQVTQLSNSPFSIYTGSAWVTVFTPDPVSGLFVVLETVSRKCRTFDALADVWGSCTDPPAFLTGKGVSGVSLPNYGANLFLVCASTTQSCAGNMYVYKHSGQPPPPPPPGTTPPAAPNGIAISTVLNFSWNESTDDVGVAGYRLFRDGVLVGETATTVFSLAVQPGAYSFYVKAFDAAGNVSGPSNSVSLTIQ